MTSPNKNLNQKDQYIENGLSPTDSIVLWNGMKFYYDMGISMIWARTETEIVGGKERPPKSPVGNWRSAQKVRFAEEALSKTMMASAVNLAPALVCGEVSGNLEIIDIDVKHWAGIDAKYFSEIKALYSELFNRLRIHRTTSGGFHIIYRCIEVIGTGSKKLACKEGGKEAGIETRGEGGIALCPPGAGYSVYQDRPIPVITRAERDALIQIAMLFDQRVKVKTVRKVKSHDAIYDENPFQHYNSSSEAERVLEDNGWIPETPDSPQFRHFTRPGKTSGISASWHKEDRYYHFFTSSTQFEPESNHDAASVLTELQFGGDYKESYKYLVEKGFGKVNKYVEERTVKKLAQTKAGILPENFSQKAKEDLLKERARYEELYPHGTFWIYNEKQNTYSVSLSQIIKVANRIGIAKYYGALVFSDGLYFEEIDESQVLTYLIEYIQEDEDDCRKITDSLMMKWKTYFDFLLKREQVTAIKKEDTLRSDEYIFYKPFHNGVLEITKDKIELNHDPTKYGKLIDRGTVIAADWEEVTEEEYLNSMYVKFLRLAIITDWRNVQKVIGYLCYDHKTRGKGYLVALLEGLIRGKGGGTGKGLFFEMLGDENPLHSRRVPTRKWTTVMSISGQQMEKGEAEMLQMWNGEEIVHFSDIPKNLNLSTLKDVITDGGPVKKLYQDVKRYGPEDYPNIGLSGQFGINVEDDPGVRRRVRTITFTDYFNVNREVRDEFGGMFPLIWSGDDWKGYYNYIACGIQEYMKEGKLQEVEDTVMMWDKNFDHIYGMGRAELREWIEDMSEIWDGKGRIKSSDLQLAYEKFCIDNNIKRDMSIPRLHEAFTKWCNRNGFDYEHGLKKRFPEGQLRCIEIKKRVVNEKEEEHDEEPLPF